MHKEVSIRVNRVTKGSESENKMKKRNRRLALGLVFLLAAQLLCGCSASPTQETDVGKIQTQKNNVQESEVQQMEESSAAVSNTSWHQPEKTIGELAYEHSMELQYADQFAVDYYEDGYVLFTIRDGGRYLLLPSAEEAVETASAADKGILDSLPEDIAVIQDTPQKIYMVATSAMDFFISLDGLDAIHLSGTNASGWYLPAAKEALEKGAIQFAGKYNAPDYELIVSEECDLAIESTMIYHTPEVKEKLEQFGIPVFVERSSYETHPLGRVEWIKLYGALLRKEETANTLFQQEIKELDGIFAEENTGQTVAFFYINSAGYANVRKSTDYVAQMIELAGGKYIFENLGEGENALSTVNMDMEEFYAGAKDADYIIYNSTIDGELDSIEQLLDKSPLLKDFKAVQNGNVWCTGKNLFQETMGLGVMIQDIHTLLTDTSGELEELTYMHRLQP